MQKYRKKPIVIDAEIWNKCGDVKEVEITKFCGEQQIEQLCKSENPCNAPLHEHGKCPTLEGHHIVCPGDWIIKGIKGEFYPCKSDIFEMTYDKL